LDTPERSAQSSVHLRENQFSNLSSQNIENANEDRLNADPSDEPNNTLRNEDQIPDEILINDLNIDAFAVLMQRRAVIVKGELDYFIIANFVLFLTLLVLLLGIAFPPLRDDFEPCLLVLLAYYCVLWVYAI